MWVRVPSGVLFILLVKYFPYLCVMKYYHYSVTKEYTLSDKGFCAESDRTFDIRVYDIAKNYKLCEALEFEYFLEPYKFINYLSLLGSYDKSSERYDKLSKNPEIRLLVTDKNLLVKVLKILKPEDIRIDMHNFNL